MFRAWLPVVVLTTGCFDPFRGRDDPSWSSWDDVETFERVPVRVASWNVQSLGEEGSRGYDAVEAVLRRLDADVVMLQEVDDIDEDALNTLGAALGYPTVAMPEGQPFGSLNNAVFSRLPEVETRFVDGADLSGDSVARDLTRRVVVHTATIPGTDAELSVVGVHWKSGFDPDDVFRRCVDAYRTAQAAQDVEASSYRLVLGDLNAQSEDMPESPAVWDGIPETVTGGYVLGDDLAEVMRDDGLTNDPYAVMREVGFAPVDLAQRDGELATRPTSGRRIDRVLADGPSQTAGLSGEVYDTRDDLPDQPGLADGTPKPDANDVQRASDHLPIVVELRVRDE